MDMLLTHGYFLYEDPHELKVMKPYPPLGILYISAFLKRAGYQVGVFDTTFTSMADFEAYIERERPPVVGLYANLMTKLHVLKMIAACKRLGATVILGGPEPASYVEEYLDRGADVIVDNVGAATMQMSQRAARKGGRILTVGNTGGPKFEFDNRYMFAKHLSLIGSTMGTQTDFRRVMGLVFSGKLRPVIDSAYPLTQARAAQERMEGNEHFGKIVLTS